MHKVTCFCCVDLILTKPNTNLLTNTSPTSSSHSQRRGAPAGGEWRQRSQEQWRGQEKPQVRAVEEEVRPGQQGKENVPRGICQSMCPARELQERESQNRLHRFEILAGTARDRHPRADALRAVKEYSRPAAGKDATNPTDLRPPAVLLKTVCYLIDDVAASPRLHPWTEVSISKSLLFLLLIRVWSRTIATHILMESLTDNRNIWHFLYRLNDS